jgi:hypothetical protein
VTFYSIFFLSHFGFLHFIWVIIIAKTQKSPASYLSCPPVPEISGSSTHPQLKKFNPSLSLPIKGRLFMKLLPRPPEVFPHQPLLPSPPLLVF